MTHGDDPDRRYMQYKNAYTNCTYLDGNLELIFLGNEKYDLSFLKDIREITGYILIVANFVDYVPLTSLRIIRGRTLFEHGSKFYSLYIALNYDSHSSTVGLKELRFTSLQGLIQIVLSIFIIISVNVVTTIFGLSSKMLFRPQNLKNIC